MNGKMIRIPTARTIRRRLKSVISDNKMLAWVCNTIKSLAGKKFGLVSFAHDISDAFSKWVVALSGDIAYRILAALIGDTKLTAATVPVVEEFLL
jgi:hypothetical protein